MDPSKTSLLFLDSSDLFNMKLFIIYQLNLSLDCEIEQKIENKRHLAEVGQN